MSPITRRRFVQGALALGASGIAAFAASARAAEPARSKVAARSGRKLPPRTEILIRNAYILTMDPALGDIPRGDVHVKDGQIAAVGGTIRAPGARPIDGAGMIVLPGFVDTHWHMWNTLARSMAGDKPELGYFRTTATLGSAFLPGDMYQGTRLAAAEAIFGGITTVHDWCHNIRGPEYAEADLRALQDTGIRGRFSYGPAQGQAPTAVMNLADLERLHRDWAARSNEGLLTLGLAWRGQGGNNARIPLEVSQAEFDTARKLGIPISVHASGSRPALGQVEALAKGNLLGKDVQIIHANFATPDEIKSLAAAGSPVSTSPYTELRIGFGLPQTGNFLSAGVTVGLSVDTAVLSGNADMFAIMKAVQNVENGKSENEFKLLPRRVLELATIEGARSMGMDDRIGSLKPGKRADLIVVSASEVNMAPFTDPAHLLVEAAQPANVDTVVIDGRILKRGGRLTAVDTRQVLNEASEALAGVRKRANRS